MGIESVFACNAQNNKELEARGEKRFRMLWQPMMSEVSHAQRLPRQRLSVNRQCAHGGRLLLMSASRLESHELCSGEAITARDVCGVGIGRWLKRPREFTLR